MNTAPNHPSAPDDAAAMRAAIRRDMLRVNTSVAVVLGALLILLFAAGLAAFRATQNLHRAEAAEAGGRERLASAYLAQARAMRVAAEPGRKQAALNAISNAAAISQSTELRTEAVACMALSDLVQEGNLIPTPIITDWTVDADLRRFVYADTRGTITFCDASGNKLFSLETGHAVAGMIISPDGHYLAVRFTDRTVTVWDSDSRRALDGPRLTAGVIASFSADSRRLIFSDASRNGQIVSCDLSNFARFNSHIEAGSHLFRASRDMRTVAVCNGPAVDIFDFESGTNITTLTHPTRSFMLTWSADGRKLAVSCEDGDIYLWDLATLKHKVLAGHSERCASMGFSPAGTMLYSSSLDGTTRVWDLSLNQTIATGVGIAHGFTADGQRLGFWRPWVGMGIWRASSSPFYSRFPCDANGGPLFALDVSPSGHWCWAIQNLGFEIWNLSAGKNGTFVRATNVYGVTISTDEQSLYVCSTNGLAVWPLTTDSKGDLNLQPSSVKQIPLPDGLGARAMVESSNGQTAAVELTDRRLVVMDTTGKNPVVTLKHRWRTTYYKGPGSATGAGRFAISPDGRWVATGFGFDVNDVPEVWDAKSGELVVKLDAATSMLGFSADGRWLGLAGTDRYSIWSVGTWRRQTEINRDEPSITHGAIAFIPRDETVAVARTRKIVQLRDLTANVVLADLISPVPQSVNVIHISLDGSVLATATASDMVEVWHLGRLRKELAAMGLDWGPAPQTTTVEKSPGQPPSRDLTLTWLGVLVVFGLAAGFTLLTLRRHRLAIKRFVVAEAMAAQRNRELDTAKVELMHSQKMQALGALATGIAHDFNNLLSVIRMSNTLVGRRAASDAEIQEHVADIEQAVLQGKGVVGSMLGYARDNHGNGEPVDVGSAVEDVVSLLSREFLGGIALILELEREAPKVALGRGTLEQILLNLVVNAAEAMQGQGNLKIIAREQDSLPDSEYVLRPRAAKKFVELSVIDSGPGIAPDLKDHIFEPFFTTKRAGSKVGTGLGLSLVYTMAQQAGAGLSVKSAPGHGAAFTLLFPVETAAPVRQTHTSQNDKSA